MIEGKRSSVVRCDEEDIISSLPEDLIDSILETLPVKDAVRTSILSKKWRYSWTNMKALVFDDHFFKKIAKNNAFGLNGFIRIINRVLFLHKGPILKFHLHIPNMFLDNFQEIDQWMYFLSRNGVTEIVLANSNRRYQLPCYMFCCRELRKLILENCFIKRPLEFKAFLNLEDLDLMNTDFGDNLSGTQINLPQLKKLCIDDCTNVYNLNIKATKLEILDVINCPDAMLLSLLQSPCLTQVTFFEKLLQESVPVKKLDFAGMLHYMPKNEYLYVDGCFFQVLIPQKFPNWLPCGNGINSLKFLMLANIQLGDFDQLKGALRLLRNLPNLDSLCVSSLKMESQVSGQAVGPGSDHILEAPNCLDCTLSRLENVAIKCFDGSRPELLFIKLLLAHSPFLRIFAITSSEVFDVQKGRDIVKNVMQFPRVSPKANLFFLNPKPIIL